MFLKAYPMSQQIIYCLKCNCIPAQQLGSSVPTTYISKLPIVYASNYEITDYLHHWNLCLKSLKLWSSILLSFIRVIIPFYNSRQYPFSNSSKILNIKHLYYCNPNPINLRFLEPRYDFCFIYQLL